MGEICFCGLVLQDKGLGWKQRRVAVLTTRKLLTFKTSRALNGTPIVRLSKNIPLSNVTKVSQGSSSSSGVKSEKSEKLEKGGEHQGQHEDGQVERVLIELSQGKKKTFDFEGEGCHSLCASLNALLAAGVE